MPVLAQSVAEFGFLSEVGSGTDDLIAHLRPGLDPFYFSSASGQLLAHGEFARVPQGDPADIVAQVRGALTAAVGRAPELCVGGIAFDGRTTRLLVPGAISRGPARPLRRVRVTGPVPEVAELITTLDAAEYGAAVEVIRRAVRSGILDKAVLARSLRVRLSRSVDIAGVLGSLAAADPNGYLFALAMDEPRPSGIVDLARPGPYLVGASPELLVSRSGTTVIAAPLAGSVARSTDPVQDAHRAAQLLESEKDRHEHEVVVRAVVAALDPYCRRLQVPKAPEVTATGTLWHLGTVIRGELADPAVTSLDLALALHPTPAVAGTPTPAALDLIASLEPQSRGFYAGAVGWCDGDGDGEWAVTIRCARIDGAAVDLYAGAGIVADSDPLTEFNETATKLRTLLDALGLPALGLSA